MNKRKVPIEVACAEIHLMWRLLEYSIISIMVGVLVWAYLSDNPFVYAVPVAFISCFVTLWSLDFIFKPKVRKSIRIILWWHKHRNTGLPDNAEFPEWAYDDFTQKSGMRVMNVTNGVSFNTKPKNILDD